jgi:KipI family sensor histidine kinase inhibitor
MPAIRTQCLPDIEALGEDAVLLRFGERIDPALNARVLAAAHQLAQRRPPWVSDIVPAYASLAVFIDATALPNTSDVQAEAMRWLRDQTFGDTTVQSERTVTIEVHYGGEHGPDLETVARHAGMTAADVIARHAAGRYTVAMLGFAPGFPYLLGLDPILAVPRLASPRLRVPAGSVAIGGAQTGIYPREGPGGWQLIGRTTQRLFDPSREQPSLLSPGDRVRFVAAPDHP